jgi:CRISPR-associated protein Csd1
MPRPKRRNVTILQALDRYYDRMARRGDAEAPGWSREKISFAIVLSEDGAPVTVDDLREMRGKKLLPRQLEVPAAVKRASNILPNLFWDKSAYVLARSEEEDQRTTREHDAFVKWNLSALGGAVDPALVALRKFLETWRPSCFDAAPFTADMLDANIIFRLDGERRYLHESDAARAIIQKLNADNGGDSAICLVTGDELPVQRLHPTIKGVQGAQPAGAALVSFNLEAFTSYGKEQGENAPTSKAAP